MPSFEYQDDELVYYVNSLSGKQREILGKKLGPDIIRRTMDNIKNAIAQEAKQRIQSKIAVTFIRGYSNGDLFNSIYTVIENDRVIVKSTKSYFSILNHGIRSFDMQEHLAGKTIKMRLPGGRIMFRKVPDVISPLTASKNKSKKIPKTGGWIYPGYSGVHIYETVAKEMELWTKTYVRNQIQDLFRAASSSNNELDNNRSYHNLRGADGRFIKKTSNFNTLFKDDLSTFGYTKLQNGSIIPQPRKKK
jgi:hypothetical protein